MTLLMIELRESLAVVITDTQVSDVNLRPVSFGPKVIHVSALNMLVGGTGHTAMVAPWVSELHVLARGGVHDIEAVNEVAPARLRSIHQRIEQQHGHMTNGYRSFHVGFPSAAQHPVLYVYDSHNGYEPQRVDGPIFWMQPLPMTFTAPAPQSVPELIDLAERVRNDWTPRHDQPSCAIGGELISTILHAGEAVTLKLHDFPEATASD